MKPSSVLSVYLGEELKMMWANHCKRQKIKSSAALREVVQHLLRRQVTSEVVTQQLPEADTSRTRVEIRLTSTELSKVEFYGDREGCSSNLWIANLVRSYLTKAPQFGMVELSRLAESNSQLLRIGRNLNQIARVLNTSLNESDSIKAQEIEQLVKAINQHTEMVSAVMTANISRWKLK